MKVRKGVFWFTIPFKEELKQELVAEDRVMVISELFSDLQAHT